MGLPCDAVIVMLRAGLELRGFSSVNARILARLGGKGKEPEHVQDGSQSFAAKIELLSVPVRTLY